MTEVFDVNGYRPRDGFDTVTYLVEHGLPDETSKNVVSELSPGQAKDLVDMFGRNVRVTRLADGT